MFGDGLRDVMGYLQALLSGNAIERFRREMRLAYLAGFLRARGIGRKPAYAGAHTANPISSEALTSV
jgi:hypothetical protein